MQSCQKDDRDINVLLSQKKEGVFANNMKNSDKISIYSNQALEYRQYSINIVTMTRRQEVPVRLPSLHEQDLIKVRSLTHHFRQGGARIENQVINNKHIYHNYGFGASAVPLAFGAAVVTDKGFTVHFDPTAEEVLCAVIGAGVSGLNMAMELVKRGRKVTVYSAEIPDLESREVNQVVSGEMPVIWMPKEYDWSEDMLKHEVISKLAYDHLRQSMDLNRYQSLKQLTVVDAVSDADQLKEVVSNYVCDMVQQTKIQYENGSIEQGSHYKTFHIDSKLYLEELKIEAMLRGVKFVQKKFGSLKEILQLKEAAIFNCTNSSSGYLFEEGGIQEQHYLIFQFQGDRSGKEEFVYRGKGKEEFQLQCVGGRRVLLIKVQEKVKGKAQIAQKLRSVQLALDSRRTRPKL